MSASSYYQISRFSTQLCGRSIEVITKPGLPDWERVRPSTALLAEHAAPPVGSRILLIGSGSGALSTVLSMRGAYVDSADTSCIALAMTRRTLEANGITNAGVIGARAITPEAVRGYDQVVLDLPKSRSLARHWLIVARLAGRPVILGGAKDEGIQSAIRDTEALFGSADVLAYGSGCRVAVASLPESELEPSPLPAWADEPGIAPGTWRTLDVELGARRVQVSTLPGVFGFEGLDEGTRLLLAALGNPEGKRVLDLGCGWGAIGISAAFGGAAAVDLVDSDELAVAAAQHNIEDLNLRNCSAIAGDGPAAAPGGAYDLILSNPPFHAGKGVTSDMASAFIHHSRDLLRPGGDLVLVANRFLRYEAVLSSSIGSVERLAENSRYRVLRSRRTPPEKPVRRPKRVTMNR